MNKLVFLLIIGQIAFSQESEAFRNDYNNPPAVTMCHHKVDGVVLEAPYIMVVNSTVCPPCSSVSRCKQEHKGINLAYAVEGLPPHLCEEVARHEW